MRGPKRPFQIRWREGYSVPSALTRSTDIAHLGTFSTRFSEVLKSVSAAQEAELLQAIRSEYGLGAAAYSERLMRSWRGGMPVRIGPSTARILQRLPAYLPHDQKFELVRILRDVTLSRLRTSNVALTLTADESLARVSLLIRELIVAQSKIILPPDLLASQAWISTGDAAVFEEMIREAEKQVLVGKAADFLLRLRQLQGLRKAVSSPAKIIATFQLPTASIMVTVLPPSARHRFHEAGSDPMNPKNTPDPDENFLAQWSNIELEQRFKSGEISYPEYVLRNMDQFFTPEEQSELHKIAAMHGLELERTLMEIQIKSRTSEADLAKLVETLKTLQEKGVAANIVSRHETPSGHIEISANSRRKLGCLPWMSGALVVFSLLGTVWAFA